MTLNPEILDPSPKGHLSSASHCRAPIGFDVSCGEGFVVGLRFQDLRFRVWGLGFEDYLEKPEP